MATLESILDLRADGAVTESWLEREFLRLLEGAGIPVPTCQARIDSRGSFVARVDFLYEPVRLVVEVSGYRHHSTRDQMSADARRRADLVAAGYTVLEFSYDQIVKEPGYVVERVRSSLADRTAA